MGNKSKHNGGFPELIAVLSAEVYGGASLSLTGLATDSHGTCNYNQRQAGNEIVDFRASLDACNCVFFPFFKTFSTVPKADYRKHIDVIMQSFVPWAQIRVADMFKQSSDGTVWDF